MSGLLSPEGALLLLVSAFSAFPSPFYGSLLAVSSWGIWAPAVLFSVHGAAVIVAMSLLHRMRSLSVHPRVLVAAALIIDAAGGIVLAIGFQTGNIVLLLAARAVTGIALGLSTPLLSERLTRGTRGTAAATAGTLGGVGVGALCAAALSTLGIPTSLVFLSGTAGLLLGVAVALRLPGRGPGVATAPGATGWTRSDGTAAALVFISNGVLGLFTSLIPLSIIARIGGGSLMAGAVVATAMLGAGGARLASKTTRPWASAVTATLALAFGSVMLATGIAVSSPIATLIGGALLGAAAGIGYDSGIRLAIGSKGDALSRVASLAKAQRAGQFGLVLPALAVPLLTPG